METESEEVKRFKEAVINRAKEIFRNSIGKNRKEDREKALREIRHLMKKHDISKHEI